jgi:hypothetical protein
MEPVDNSQRKLSKIVYNDDLGYAIVYYKPILNLELKPHVPKTVPRRRRVLEIDERPAVFSDEVKELIRKKENESLASDIRDTCNIVRELFKRCERYDMSRREILNDKVKARIKGKKADEICDILVEDSLRHTKHLYNNNRDDVIPHKIKYKIAAAAVQRYPTPTKVSKYFKSFSDDESEDDEENSKAKRSVTKCTDYVLNRDIDAQIFERKYGVLMDKMRCDLIHMWGKCYK